VGARGGARRLKAIAATLGVAGALLLAAAPAGAWEIVTGPPKEVVVSWSFLREPRIEGLHTVTITLLGGTCGGEPEPLPGKVSIVELPVSAANPRPTALITAHQLEPAPREAVGEIVPGESKLVCAGLGWSATKRIKLKRPVRGMRLLDPSWDPPKRRSPPGGMR
jgi:hypothetical protein